MIIDGAQDDKFHRGHYSDSGVVVRIICCPKRPRAHWSSSFWLVGPKRRDLDTELLEWLGFRYLYSAALALVAED